MTWNEVMFYLGGSAKEPAAGLVPNALRDVQKEKLDLYKHSYMESFIGQGSINDVIRKANAADANIAIGKATLSDGTTWVIYLTCEKVGDPVRTWIYNPSTKVEREVGAALALQIKTVTI
ncbi:MAG: hypothetical protein V1756_00300 [Patescibacteria group bacterium]